VRIVVLGTGGVGGYFGGRLAQAGESVAFVARGAHLEAIRRDGLRVESIAGDFVVQPAEASDDPARLGAADAVLVAVKAWQVPEAALALRPLLTGDSVVVPLQNGVEAADQLATILFPPRKDGPFQVTRAHAELAQQHGTGAVCTIPLTVGASVLGAIVLECTNMPPYRADIQALAGLPVFDITTLVRMVHEAVRHGLAPRPA